MFVGLDLGQSQDPTAIAVLDYVGPPNGIRLFAAGQEPKPIYRVRGLERPPLGTPYPKIVDRVVAILGKLHKPQLVIDATGVGRPVVDLFHERGIYGHAVTITGGDNFNQDGRELRVPKRDLVGAAQVLLQSGRLRIAEGLALTPILVKELQAFRVKISANARDTYSAREGEHDDLVLAVALACWSAVRWTGDRYRPDPLTDKLSEAETRLILGKRADDRLRRKKLQAKQDPDGMFEPLEDMG